MDADKYWLIKDFIGENREIVKCCGMNLGANQ